MNKRLQTITFLCITLLCILFISDTFAAGPPGPPDGGDDPPCWPPPCIPIDGGIGFLIAAGLAYGGKKALGSFKNDKI